LEVNGGALNVKGFFEQIIPAWQEERAILFVDEIHAVPVQLQEVWLTMLNPEKTTRRVLRHGEFTAEIDFAHTPFIAATTDQQRLLEPLWDRFREVSLLPYSREELWEIWLLNSEPSYDPKLKEDIVDSFRGNPRHVVKLAEDLNAYLSSTNATFLNRDTWEKFKTIAGIKIFGLTSSEISVLRILGVRGPSTLQTLSAATGFSRSVIQHNHEKHLIAHGLMLIDGKRAITQQGREILKKIA
jgi:Holliday junction resolvasome RuvABC ATP-dependent DNA helicase subunit